MDSFASRLAASLRTAKRRYLMAKARLRGSAFWCRALAGGSQLNLCVNSDMTVSCNCHDVDGSGRVGDLARQSLAEVLSGPTAAEFRRQLAGGVLPTPHCARCCDLVSVDRGRAVRMAGEVRMPRFMMVENTVACNLRCLSCPRGQIRKLRSRVSMTLDDVRRVAEELKEAGVERVGYLNLGEPFLSRNIRRELEIFREVHPAVILGTSTNGMPLDNDEKREAALLVDEIQFSIDGISQPMMARYQRGADFEAAYRNLKDLAAFRDARGSRRPRITWKYLLFRWTDRRRDLLRAVELAREAQADRILFERTLSPVYAVSWRAMLGLLNDIGEDLDGHRCVVLRPDVEREEFAGVEEHVGLRIED